MNKTHDMSLLADTEKLATLPQNALKDSKELAALPQTLVEVLRVTKDEEKWSIHELVDALMRDPAMTKKILRIANSALYGTRAKITTLSQAVMTLGIRPVRALALTSSIYDMTGNWKGSLDLVRFWKHSLQVAIASRLIAEKSGNSQSEESFICGLLHDIGVPLLEKSCPHDFNHIWGQVSERESMSEQEELNWRTLHSEMGRTFMVHWNLPSVICQAAGEHHNALLAHSKSQGDRASQIVALANLSAPFTLREQRGLTTDQETKETLRNSLDLSLEDLREIEKNTLAKTIEEARFLEINIGSLDDILLEANRLIYKQYLAATKELCQSNKKADPAYLDKILLEANSVIVKQHKEMEDRLQKKESLPKKTNKGLPDEIYLDANHIICEQYFTMENLLRETRQKIEIAIKTKAPS